MTNGSVVEFVERLGLPAWAAALLALSLAGLFAILVRKALEVVAVRLTKHRAPAVDALIDALRTPVTLLFFLLGVELSLELAELPARYMAGPSRAVSVISILVAAYGFGKGLLALISAETPLTDRLVPVAGFLKGVVRVLVGTVAILLALQALGVSVTPLLASVGLGSAAVAFALRETFESFFAGVALLADHPIRVGERIRLEPDLEGKVVTIGWRTTSLLDFNNNTVIVPNTTMVRSVIRNFDRPSPNETTPFKVLVEHGTPIAHAVAAARAAAGPFGGSANVSDVTPTGIEITVALPVKQREERPAVRAAGLLAVAEQFERAGVRFARSKDASSREEPAPATEAPPAEGES